MKSVWLVFWSVIVVGLLMAMLNSVCGIVDRAVVMGLLVMIVAVHCKADVKADVIEHARLTVYVVM